MEASSNVAPIIIKKVKKGGGDGHHGGAWKVAYADFVTAMMAFFMLMWLLNATTEKQRKGIADYFAPTIAIAKVSGGGDGTLGGDSVFTEESLARNGTGATSLQPTESDKARGVQDDDDGAAEDEETFKEVSSELMGRGGESEVMENAMQHVVTRVTDEGLVIEFFSRPNAPLFEPGTNEPTQLLVNIAQIVANVTKAVTNPMAIEGHVPAQPVVVAASTIWENSAARADNVRQLLFERGVENKRIQRVTGYADREPVSDNPMASRNDRLEIILLRTNLK